VLDEQRRQTQRSGLEPELGGILRHGAQRSGLELGGGLRQKALYVDEVTCIGCGLCAWVARNTFYLEPEHGRSRVINQQGDDEVLLEEAVQSCPVDCIHWVDMNELPPLEEARQYQVITTIGLPPTSRKVRSRKNLRRLTKP
jgi:ferredoxin